MELNSINTNIQNLDNSNSPLQLNKNNQASKVEEVSFKESLNLDIKEYNSKRDELSLNVQNLNEGIAQIKISQNGLEEQKSILQTIQQNIQDAQNEDGKILDSNELKNSLNTDLQKYNEVAYQTTFNGQSLLSNDMYEESNNQITISTKNGNYDIDKPDTTLVSNDIFNTYNTSDLAQPQAVDQLTQKVESSVNQIQNIIDQFTSFGDRLETSARETIQEQISMYNENTSKDLTNYVKESTDFNKTNVTANQGYFVASQANIVQEQSQRLIGRN